MCTRRSPRTLLVAMAVFIAVGTTHAADLLPRATQPEEVGLSSERLERLTHVTQAHVETGRLPGAVFVIARYGKIAYFKSFGYRDRATEAPMATDAIFRLHSITKPITCVAVMILHEEGKLQVYDPVSRYLPELANLKVGIEKTDPATGQPTFDTVEVQREITIQDLLRHTSGLTYGSPNGAHVKELYHEAMIGNRNDTNAELVTKLSTLPLLYQPGTRWEYSVSTDVLGRVVEVLSGQSLGEFFTERIFRPLGMQDTGFHVPADKLDRAAQPWTQPGGPPIGPQFFDVASAPTFQSGGGGLVSTALDYLRFAQMLLHGGEWQGVRLLGRKTVEFMTADHLGSIHYDAPSVGFGTPGMGFGLGVQVRRDAGIAKLPGSVGEYGWGGAAGTLFWIDPSEQLIAIYMIQGRYADRFYLRNQFKSLVSQARFPRI